MKFRLYNRKANPSHLCPWKPGMDLVGVSISAEDKIAGSPKVGDMIARNPSNYADKWLVAKAYFEHNFEPEALD